MSENGVFYLEFAKAAFHKIESTQIQKLRKFVFFDLFWFLTAKMLFSVVTMTNVTQCGNPYSSK